MDGKLRDARQTDLRARPELPMKPRLMLLLLLATLSLSGVSFGLKIDTTGTPTCNGNNVTLDFQSIGYNNSTGTDTIPFSINVSVSGTTAQPVCSGDFVTFAINASSATVTFDKPVIGTDATSYDPLQETFEFDANGYANYFALFSFTDNTTLTGIFDNIVTVSLTSQKSAAQWGFDSNGNLTFDPSGVVVIGANGSAPPVGTPEPGSLALLGSSLASVALLRRKFVA